ncbi:hypothetical protein ACIBG7_07320 [Nonomuraea sp. NPDC050328]|uniref:hypothetical protein n=1 Tax=Nonomuraea sp. NPDC050328 TaxID=3364361 RepID=UPI00378890EF
MKDDEIIALVRAESSPWRRLRGTVALLGGLVGGTFLVTLWATEPGPLPDRTRLVFALLALICAGWTAFGAWSVLGPRPLFALDGLVAGWLALAASLATTAVTVTVAADRGTGLAVAIAAGALFIGASAAITVRAHLRFRKIVRELARHRD